MNEWNRQPGKAIMHGSSPDTFYIPENRYSGMIKKKLDRYGTFSKHAYYEVDLTGCGTHKLDCLIWFSRLWLSIITGTA